MQKDVKLHMGGAHKSQAAENQNATPADNDKTHVLQTILCSNKHIGAPALNVRRTNILYEF